MAACLLYGSALTDIHDHCEDHSLDYIDLCWQSNVSAFNTMSRFVIAFLSRSNHLLISWLQSPSAVIFKPKKRKSVTTSTLSPSTCGEVVTNFLFLGSKITADGDWSQEIKRLLLLDRKAMTNLDSVLKNRDITLLTKVHVVKALVFPVVMYGCESCAVKKVKHQRIDTFQLWCWRRLLKVPWTERRPNQSILREINPEYSLEMSGECVISSVLSCHNKNLK